MRFDDLPLYCAVARVRDKIKALSKEGHLKSLSSEYWQRGDGAIELTRMITDELITEANELYVDAFVRYRKGDNVDQEGNKKLDIITALASGVKTPRCFYHNRGIGPCSEDVDLDRILPGSQGGKYSIANCVISCSKHNRQRGDTALVDFLNSGSVS
jgi:CRISPR/Cas system Type II protein with McrA/HNH and RuvC-like nuclease domain